MKKFTKIVSIIALILLVLLIGIPTALYIALSLPWAQDELRSIGEDELTTLLGTKVTIDKVSVEPFNRLKVQGIEAEDDFGKTAAHIGDVSARFELVHFIRTGRIVIDYAIIDSLDITLYRKTPDSSLNIANIIKKLSKKEPETQPKKFSLAISTVRITDSRLSYDILSEPRSDSHKFNPKHLSINNLNVTAYLPKLKNDDIEVSLAELSLCEQSGFYIDNLHADVHYTPNSLGISGLQIQLPESRLSFAPIELKYDSPQDIAKAGTRIPLHLALTDHSYITPSDLKAFYSPLAILDERFDLDLDAAGTRSAMQIKKLALKSPINGIDAVLSGNLSNLSSRDSLGFKNLKLKIQASQKAISTLFDLAPHPKVAKIREMALRPGDIMLTANADGNILDFSATAMLKTTAGGLDISAEVAREGKRYDIDADVDIKALDIHRLVPQIKIPTLTANAGFDITLTPGQLPSGMAEASISHVVYNGHEIKNIDLGAMSQKGVIDGALLLDDKTSGYIDLSYTVDTDKSRPSVKVNGKITDFATDILGLAARYPGFKLTTGIDADIAGIKDRYIDGYVNIDNFRYEGDGERAGISMNHFGIVADNNSRPNTITITSDILNGKLQGRFMLNTLGVQFNQMVSNILPAYIPDPGYISYDTERYNKFDFELRLSNAEQLSHFLGLPVDIIYPVDIDGAFDYGQRTFTAAIDAPYLLKGSNIVENTALQINVDGNTGVADLYATTTMPTQKGPLALVTGLTAAANRIDTKINWRIDREKPISGDMSLSALLQRDENNRFMADVDFNPGDITFGNDVWHIAKSSIKYAHNSITVNGLKLTAADQSIAINGVADDNPFSAMDIDIDNLQLISIFETLDINKALIGGRATGTFHGNALLSTAPSLFCQRLHVKDISYNYCTLGDADIKAWWDNDKKAFTLNADVIEPGGMHSTINGDIFATKEALDIDINANHVKVGFLKPFMSAFAQDVSGYASGHARLFGTFKLIDLTAELKADSLGLKIGFTNTWYYAKDSVIITPGRINIDNITVRDAYGHTALLNGFVTHNYFHDPVFDFRITDARNLLCYDVTPKLSPDWYGKIFGNGGAVISGRPGVVDINVNMSTAPGSTFTFVLSDTEEADDYSFITFRDRTARQDTDTILGVSHLPKAVLEYQQRMLAGKSAETPSTYNMDIQVDITPAARVNLIMDPVGGDEIKSNGTGNLRMTYTSPGNELHMYGNYTIEHGSYNFTLQDIIVKDFTIDEGSSITFTGDPYAANLDIKAKYPVNANLSDLDESFLQDKDLNRTNVPVNAVLMAKGDMRQPDISFDLNFPTLNSDVYRKVRSIVSTDEMMNRQIIYLLALNRFYTPEYMSTTKGNELFSVASSTIASQLSSMLGKLSENWSIAPNLRSDRGDFSDVEVDVALSSNLLNNRLRLNGNFGYRDKSLNTNQFIGDFDIEYLLNRRGTWRLKAYNRYNDQNYYLRTAQTTQGVGIMFKRDFDNMFNFLKPRKRTAPSDSTSTDKKEEGKPASDTRQTKPKDVD